MTLDNDTRGWIMTCISGLACVIGASIICADFVVRLCPGMDKFSIAESDAFLSASLSLSFGVMLFSALYSMLPQSKHYLEHGGYSAQAASYLLIVLFLAGVLGIQLLSRALHRFIPSHVVDCDHTHDEEEGVVSAEEMEQNPHDDDHANNMPIVKFAPIPAEEEADEDTPLLSRTTSISPPKPRISTPSHNSTNPPSEIGFVTAPTSRRPSAMPRSITRTFTLLATGKKTRCDENGPCKGYSDPCGQECFGTISKRNSSLASIPPRSRATTWLGFAEMHYVAPVPEIDERPANERAQSDNGDVRSRTATNGSIFQPKVRSRSATHHYHHPEGDHLEPVKQDRRASTSTHSVGPEHHHHVPTNAFLSIGLQTSIAIALHKAPEGFITYATNHANPTLGFAVFMALFIHNITEGFAMSLPLYLALRSRGKAIAWSSILGGLSQPLGAGVAALWFKLAKKHGNGAPGEGVYGGMFAVTAGVMTSVALSLFSESLQLSHNRGTCIAFAFLGMGILGVSFAMTA